MTTGERIRDLRIRGRLSQEELGRRIGVQKAAINKYETGRVVNLKRATLEKLAAALDTTPAWLLGLEDERLTQEEWELIQGYRSASEDIRAAIRRIAEE